MSQVLSIRKWALRIVVWATVLLLICTAPLVAEDRWPDERQAGPFVFHANFSLDGHEHLVADTSALQRDLNEKLGIGQLREPVHLFLFSRKSTYQKYMQQFFPAVPYRRALFIKRRGPGMVFAHVNREFEIDVRHESTHAVLHACLSHVPLWLDEGLAEYFEVAPDERAFANPHLKTLCREVTSGSASTIESLEAITGVEEMGHAQYRHAWSWAHFMLHGPVEAHDELVRYFADIKNDVPAGRLSIRLRRRLPDLDFRYAEHFRTWTK